MDHSEENEKSDICKNDVSISSNSPNISSTKRHILNKTVFDETSEFQEDSSSERDSSLLSNSSDVKLESELQSNEVTSESVNISHNTNDYDREAEAKIESVSEISLTKTKHRENMPNFSTDQATLEIDRTSEQSIGDDRVTSSELTKSLISDDSSDIQQLTTVEKSVLPDNEDSIHDQELEKEITEEMEVDVKEGDEESKEQSNQSLSSKELGHNILSDNAVDNTTFKDITEKEISFSTTMHNVIESSLDKDMDSTNDSQILEHDLKLSDDSSDNLIIIDEESKASNVSKNETIISKDKVHKSFENLAEAISKDEVDKTSINNNTLTKMETSQKVNSKRKSKQATTEDILSENKNTVISEISLKDKIPAEVKDTELPLNVKNGTNVQLTVDSEVVKCSTNSDRTSLDTLPKPSNLGKRKYSKGKTAKKMSIPSNEADLKSDLAEDNNSKINTSLKEEANSDLNISKESLNNADSKISSSDKQSESKSDPSLIDLLTAHETDSKSLVSADVVHENISSKSSVVNTSVSSKQESSVMSSSNGSHPTENEKVPLRTPRNKVKKRPYSPDMTPSANYKVSTPVNKVSTPVNKVSTPVSSNPPSKSTPASTGNSPGSAQRKKLKKFNEEDVVIPFKYGWMRELVHRATAPGKSRASDVYYFTPEGNKLRSMPEISKYLSDHEGHGLTADNFTFAKETIYRSPFEREREANVKSNIVSASTSKTLTPTSKTPTPVKKKPVKKSIEQSITSESPQVSSKLQDSPSVEKSKPAKLESTNSEKSKPTKTLEKGTSKPELSIEKRKAETESNTVGNRKTRLRSSDSITSDSSTKDNVDKTTEHRSKTAKLSSDSGTKTKKIEKKSPIIKVKFTKNFGKNKTTPPVVRASGDIEDDLQQILTTSCEKSSSKSTDGKSAVKMKSAPSKSSQVAQVCHTWKKQAQQNNLWRKVSLKGFNIRNWEKCTESLKKNGTKILDMRGLHDECMENTWQNFVKCVENLENVEHLIFDQVPPKVLETVADCLPLLRSLECYCLTATFKRPDLWETPCQLNFSNIRYLRKLRKLKIRSAGGLISQDASSVLQNLPELRHLSLTTIKVSASDHLNFLSKLQKLVYLEFGDCNTWTKENYQALGDLKDLRHLRLENGGDFHDTSLPDALKKLNNLEDLELMNFKIPRMLGEALANLKLLTKLSLWPDMSKQVPEVNYNTFQCVIQAKSVKYFCWGIISIDDCIPLLQFSKDPMPSVQSDQKNNIEELDYEELFERLCKVLPDDAKAEIKCISHSFLNEYCCIKR